MRILTRYILREFIVPLAYCLGGFISIYVLFELFGSFSHLASAHLPFRITVRYFCAYLAPYFEYLAPAALMLATLYTMWGFCRHSELIAMRANGIGFMAIARPLLAVSLAMAGFVYWINDCYVPAHAKWARRLRSERFNLEEAGRADNIVYRNTMAGRTWTIGSLEGGDPAHLHDVRVAIDRPGGGARLLTVTAERADYLDGEWWFTSPQVRHYDERGAESISPTPAVDSLPLRSLSFADAPSDLLLQNGDCEYLSLADRRAYLRLNTNLDDEKRRKYRYGILSRIVSPFACLIITLFAIPAGIASGRQSVFRGILGALGMFFAFYGATFGCMAAAEIGWMPVWLAAIAPHVVFLLLGAVSFYRNR